MSNQVKKINIQSLMQSSGVRFGTSGVRGLVDEMSDELCFCYTLAFAKSLSLARNSVVAIAIDLRPSSTRIAAACCDALNSLDITVVFLGELPTPALAYYAEQNKIPGIMVTGSHIPFDRNGIKFYSAEGEITKAHETSISQSIVEVNQEKFTTKLPKIINDAKQMYQNRYIDFFPKKCLTGLTVAFYQHSSVARDLLSELLVEMGAKVISLGRTEQFVPIDTEAVAESDVQRAKSWSEEFNFDVIISTDGDADRPLIGDEKGQWMRGDIVGLLTARYLCADFVAAPISCNTAIEACGFFKSVARTRIGSPYVIEAMQSHLNNFSKVVGFEANGGFLLASTLQNDHGILPPLCTRDAVLPILSVIALAKLQLIPISELIHQLPSKFTASDRIQNFDTAKSKTLLNRLSENHSDIDKLFDVLCGKFNRIDQTDGLRILFENNEIVHFRPSGNAPELRCYAEAASQLRAEYLVEHALIYIQDYASW